MKELEIAVSKSRKVNTGNYTSRDYFCSIRAEINEAEDTNKIAKALFEKCNKAIVEEIEKDGFKAD